MRWWTHTAEELRAAATPAAEPLWRIVYVSAAQPDLSTYEQEFLLRSARNRNIALDVTGLLVLVDDTFCQILEGSLENVNGLLERIKRDRRHSHLRLLQRQPIRTRSFPDWTMSPPSRTIREFSQAPDVESFFDGMRPRFNVSDPQLRHILILFHSGAFAEKMPPHEHHDAAHSAHASSS